MRFALKAAQAEPLFVSALYMGSGDIYWTNKADDACSYSSLERAKDAATLSGKQLEIIPVPH
mgnify:FL=1|jgi:hypothetical protein|tara:strand:- start:400 stop:585 length:186 start_codon:yes stop_codon:yes gene_type:complete